MSTPKTWKSRHLYTIPLLVCQFITIVIFLVVAGISKDKADFHVTPVAVLFALTASSMIAGIANNKAFGFTLALCIGLVGLAFVIPAGAAMYDEYSACHFSSSQLRKARSCWNQAEKSAGAQASDVQREAYLSQCSDLPDIFKPSGGICTTVTNEHILTAKETFSFMHLIGMSVLHVVILIQAARVTALGIRIDEHIQEADRITTGLAIHRGLLSKDEQEQKAAKHLREVAVNLHEEFELVIDSLDSAPSLNKKKKT
jgi:hypothetical protein